MLEGHWGEQRFSYRDRPVTNNSQRCFLPLDGGDVPTVFEGVLYEPGQFQKLLVSPESRTQVSNACGSGRTAGVMTDPPRTPRSAVLPWTAWSADHPGHGRRT